MGAASEAEILAVYPHRWEAPRDAWSKPFAAAEREIAILVYAGLFLAEDADVQKMLAGKARAGVRPTGRANAGERAPARSGSMRW